MAAESAAAGGLRMSGHRQRSGEVKRRRWGGLRQQWKLLGLFEIDQHHEFYSLTCMMKEGLAAAIQITIEKAPTNELSDDDFRLEITQIHKDFAMETFAGPVFASLRGSLGMTEQEYQQSLCSENCYLQFISNSKSKADFFLTYDIKGCEVSRWTDPAPEGSQIIVVLKDLNFEGQYITLDQQRPWLLRQMEIDTQFLRRLNVLDYSLLLAHQPLHHDERHQSLSFATLIMRTKKSVNPGSSPIHAGVAAVPGAVPEDDSSLLLSETHGGCLTQAQVGDAPSGGTLLPHCLSGPGSEAAELPDFRAQNRRLLPNLKNPLHIIDGPDQRYFIGIIDIFTVYSFKKRLEHLWKRLRHPGRTFSTVSPQTYCVRLCQWVQNHTKESLMDA
eukprot:superscaffoldBa00000552_g5595